MAGNISAPPPWSVNLLRREDDGTVRSIDGKKFAVAEFGAVRSSGKLSGRRRRRHGQPGTRLKHEDHRGILFIRGGSADLRERRVGSPFFGSAWIGSVTGAPSSAQEGNSPARGGRHFRAAGRTGGALSLAGNPRVLHRRGKRFAADQRVDGPFDRTGVSVVYLRCTNDPCRANKCHDLTTPSSVRPSYHIMVF